MSSGAIEKVGNVAMAVASWTREQRELIKATCARDATDDELALFLHVAAQSGLDPLRRQIHFMKYQGRVTIVADINGLQARAAREADFEGILHAVVYAKDVFEVNHVTGEVVKHTSNPLGANGDVVGAWAVVRRKGKLPFVSIVRFNEYFNTANANWKSKPTVMIDKCAKSTALRLAYPEQLGGIYDEAEMGKVEKEINPAPATAESVTPTAPAKTAKEAQAQLAAKVAALNAHAPQTVDAKPKTKTMHVEDVTLEAGKARWARIKALGEEAGMNERECGAHLKALTGKTGTKMLTDEDVTRFGASLEPHADSEPPLPPPPTDADAQPADAPF